MPFPTDDSIDDFYLGEHVNVGTQLGVIDEITQGARVIVTNADGFPEERWFPMHLIAKTRKN
jgi:hypothetical protein